MGANMHPKERGQKTEAAVIYEFVKRDFTVLEPFGDNERYDIVIEHSGDFHRVQIKTGRLEDGRVQFETRSTGTLTRKVEKEVYKGDADLFAVFSPELESTYIVPVSESPNTSMGLRVSEPEKESPNINWAEEFSLEKWAKDVRREK